MIYCDLFLKVYYMMAKTSITYFWAQQRNLSAFCIVSTLDATSRTRRVLRIPDLVSSGRSFSGQAGKVLLGHLHLFFTEVLAAYGYLRSFLMSGLA